MRLIQGADFSICSAIGSNNIPPWDSHPFHRTHPPHPQEGNFPGSSYLGLEILAAIGNVLILHLFFSSFVDKEKVWLMQMPLKFLGEIGKETQWKTWKEVILFWTLFRGFIVLFLFFNGKLNNSLQVQWRLWDDYTGHLQNLYIQIWKKLIVLEDICF